MAERVTLTDAYIRNLTAPDKRTEIYDEVVTGLILRVTKTGYRSFALRYWYDEQSKQMTIGKFGDFTLSEARDKARELKKVVAEGRDPVRERQQERDKNRITLGEYIDLFKKGYVRRKLKKSTQQTYSSRLNKVKANGLARKELERVTRVDVRNFLKEEAKENPTNANRLHSILSKLFNEAIEDGLLKQNPIKGMEKISRENARDPRYSQEDLIKIWEAISEEPDPLKSALKILMLTGQREGETSRMKWGDIHGDVWIIPRSETKTDSTHEVPLSNLALEALESVKAINGTKEYVFSSLRKVGQPISHFASAIQRIRERTGLEDFIIHDLRHIVATNMIELGVEFIYVGRVLNHKGLSGGNSITSRYINSDFKEQKRNALNKWANYLNRLVNNEETAGNILRLR